MKKYFNILVALALAVSATTITSCGDDDDDPVEPPITHKTVKEANIATSLYVNQNMLEAFDIVGTTLQGEYLDFASTPETVTFSDGEAVQMYPMTVKGTGKTVPVSSIMTVTITLKDGYTVPESNDFAFSVQASGKITYTDGSTSPFSAKGFSVHNKGVFGSKIVEYTQYLNRHLGRIEGILSETGIELTNSSAAE